MATANCDQSEVPGSRRKPPGDTLGAETPIIKHAKVSTVSKVTETISRSPIELGEGAQHTRRSRTVGVYVCVVLPPIRHIYPIEFSPLSAALSSLLNRRKTNI